MSTRRIPHPTANPVIWHGCDWNPEQWLDRPEVIDEDFRLFKEAGMTTLSVGIFSWSRLEPEEGRYSFGWLDRIMDRLAQAGLRAVLATPSGAKPAWMARRHPEVLRVQANRVRDLQGGRHNHCPTSPYYRMKSAAINSALAERYHDHPALALWHVSNEYSGECHCPLCLAAFRSWLLARYGSLEALNAAWWTDFWSHRYSDWNQVESPAPQGETSVNGLNLDWKRFTDHQLLNFFLAESEPLRRLAPDVPITTNMMGTYPGIDPWKWAKHLDVMSWDNYPRWHDAERSDADTASRTAFLHDLNRSIKGGKPFLMLESTPSQVQWEPVNRLKAPGMHRLASLQAVAHGSDSVMYFQWRKSRGSFEKYHGGVVDHAGSDTRVFREVAGLGAELAGIGGVAGSRVPAEAAVVYDWENRWAVDDFSGYNKPERDYERLCVEFHRGLWKRSIPCDVPNQDQDLRRYKLVAAPMLHLLKPGTAERLAAFTEDGGILVTTFLTGYVGESDLVFQGGFPGPLRRNAGIWAEELDALWEGQSNRAVTVAGNPLGLGGAWRVSGFCELVNAEGAETLAVYGDDWYAGRPALTRHRVGKGWHYHLAARAEPAFIEALMARLADEAGLASAWPEPLPPGVQAQARRATDGSEHVFLMNWNREPAAGLPGYGCRIERRRR